MPPDTNDAPPPAQDGGDSSQQSSDPRASVFANAMADVMRSKGLAPAASDPPPADPTASTEPPPGPPAGEPPPADPAKQQEPPKDARELYDRLARKDALYQQERNRAKTLEQQIAELKQQQEQFYSRLSTDPIAVLRERNIRFGDLAAQALYGKGAQGEGGDQNEPQQQRTASPELDELKRLVKEQNDFIAQIKQEREQQTQRTAFETQVGLVRDLLKDKEYPLVNDLSKHDEVLVRVSKHVGQHGAFADDREAAEVVEHYAREIEAEERQRLLSFTSKPGVKNLLARELGLSAPQNGRTPARQDTQGNPAARNPAPALSNDVSAQRGAVVEPPELTREEMLRRTASEMQGLYSRQRA